ncbi:MAG: hypothetical protein ACRDQ1_11605 [Sciscionella sp.]
MRRNQFLYEPKGRPMSTNKQPASPSEAAAAYPKDARAVVLTKRGSADTAPIFEITAVPVRPPRHGEVVVRNLVTSVDPYMGCRMRSDTFSYAEPYPEGRPVAADSVGVVVASEHPDIKVGGWLLNDSGWREFTTVVGDVWSTCRPVRRCPRLPPAPGTRTHRGLPSPCRRRLRWSHARAHHRGQKWGGVMPLMLMFREINRPHVPGQGMQGRARAAERVSNAGVLDVVSEPVRGVSLPLSGDLGRDRGHAEAESFPAAPAGQ